MATKDHRASALSSQRLRHLGGFAILLSVTLIAVAILNRDGDSAGSARPSLTSTLQSTPTSTTIDPRNEIIARLREILRIRDSAFRQRNAAPLSSVYTVDCPCLEGDQNAIEELRSKDYRMVGGATSIRVRRTERVNGRLWLVIADFQSAPLRIESEDRKLIREEPAGSDLFQFAIAKPIGTGEWLLGRATAYRDG